VRTRSGNRSPSSGEDLDHGPCGARAGEGREQVTDGLLDPGVGIHHDAPGGIVDEPDRKRDDELAAAGLGEHVIRAAWGTDRRRTGAA